jgi:hypothetical protein
MNADAATEEPQDERKRVKSNGKKPWMPLWYLDWKSDPCLSKCSMAAQGLWLRICIDMFIDDESGEIKGSAKMLARSYGISAAEFSEWASELAESGTADVSKMGSDGVAKKMDGVTGWQINGVTDRVIIHNRRMRKALNKSKLCSEAGKKGAETRWRNDRVTHSEPEWRSDSDPLSLSLQSTSQSLSTSEQSQSDSQAESVSEELAVSQEEGSLDI